MGRKPLSSYPPEVAAKMRADYSARFRENWAKRDSNKLGSRANAALRPEVQQRIAESVKARWQEGAYAGRVNGMAGMVGSLHPTWTWGRNDFKEILTQHEPPQCALCGEADDKLDVHHVDENHDNYLLTNLMHLCVPCHLWRFHYGDRPSAGHVKRPFVSLTKEVRFEYAHVLPWHHGKCGRIHGHSGRLVAEVRARLDPNDCVMDFYDLGAALKVIHELVDHQMLNDLIENPTSEALLVWTWGKLESIGIKGLSRLVFAETDSSTSSLTASDMIEAFGWDRTEHGEWVFVPKKVR